MVNLARSKVDQKRIPGILVERNGIKNKISLERLADMRDRWDAGRNIIERYNHGPSKSV